MSDSSAEQEQLTFSLGEPPVNHFPLQGSEVDWMTSVATSRLSFVELQKRNSPDGSFGKMSQVVSAQTGDGTLEVSSGRWLNAGTISRGEYWTLKIGESHKDAEECSLSDILEQMSEELQRYCLSPTACRGVLRRAEKRGKKLPPLLQAALHTRAQETSE